MARKQTFTAPYNILIPEQTTTEEIPAPEQAPIEETPAPEQAPTKKKEDKRNRKTVKEDDYRFTMRVSRECGEYVQEMAWRNRITITEFISRIIEADMKEHPEWKDTVDILNITHKWYVCYASYVTHI